MASKPSKAKPATKATPKPSAKRPTARKAPAKGC